MRFLCPLVLTYLISSTALAVDMMGRMGIGMSNQFKGGNLQALSAKIQKSRNTAMGALVAVDSNDNSTDYGLGIKLYRIIFDEPQLNFYAAGLLGMTDQNSESGFQIDATLGSEFHLPGIESLGLSFEFGFSINRLNSSTSMQTVGYNFLNASIHFYL